MAKRPWLLFVLLAVMLGMAAYVLFVDPGWLVSDTDSRAARHAYIPEDSDFAADTHEQPDNHPSRHETGRYEGASAGKTESTNGGAQGPPVRGTETPGATDDGETSDDPENKAKAEDAPRGRQADLTHGGISGRSVEGFGTSVALSPDGTMAATSGDERLYMWSVESVEPVWVIPGIQFGVVGAAFHPDGKTLLHVNKDKQVALVAADTGEARWTIPAGASSPSSLLWHPDGATLYVAQHDGRLAIHNASDGTKLKDLPRLERAASCMRWHRSLGCPLVMDNQGHLLALEAEPRALCRVVERDIGPDFIVSADERAALVATGRGLSSWSLDTGNKLREHELDQHTSLSEVQSLTGNQVLVLTRSFTTSQLEVWDATDFRSVSSTSSTYIAGVASNGRDRVVTTTLNGEVQFWQLEHGALKLLGGAPVPVYTWGSWSRDGRHVVMAEQSGRVSTREADTMRELHGFDTEHPLGTVTTAPLSDRLLVVDGTSRAWLSNTDGSERVKLARWGEMDMHQFSRDGTRLWILTSEGVQEFDVATGEATGKLLPGGTVPGFRVNQDGTRVVTAHGSSVAVHDLPVTTPGEPLPHDFKGAYQAWFTPDGLTLVINDQQGPVIWDLAVNAARATLALKDNHLSLSPDGTEIASCDQSGVIRRWNLDGELLETLDGVEFSWGLKYSPDGSRLLAVCESGVARIWKLNR